MNCDRFVTFGACLLAAATITGCAHDVRTANASHMVRLGPSEGPTGSVEFSAPNAYAVVPIYHLDAKGIPHLISAVGLQPGDHYDFDRSGAVAAQRVTVATPPGTQQFRIEDEGPAVQVPVVEGKVTPVTIQYNLLAQGPQFVVYSADVHVQPPMNEPARNGPAKK